MRRLLLILFLLLLGAAAGSVRSWNLRDVFVEGRIFFVDPDCYSRMTRAALVQSGYELVVRQHTFENFPAGTRPHASSLMDWLIVATEWPLDLLIARGSVLRPQTLDLAGALLPPLLGALTCAGVVFALRRMNRGAAPPLPRGSAWAAGLLLAISPMVVHGTLLGRPDHQALLIPLLAVALLAELRLLGKRGAAANPEPAGNAGALSDATARPQRQSRTAMVAGAAWALACWVSWYEPLILFVLVLVFWLVADRQRFTSRSMRAGWIVFLAITATSLLVNGWRVSWPDPALREAFTRWSREIAELQHATPARLFAWNGGWLLALAPVLLFLAARRDRRAALLLLLCVALIGLTFWQVRWGYFLALVFAVSMPWIFATLRRPVIGWTPLVISLWPVAQAWEQQLFPDAEGERAGAMRRAENLALREIAELQGARQAGAFAAPWWLSPSIAYWSGQPGIAGSSHESLPGILDSARIYLAEDAAAALPILRSRGVQWILSDAPERVIGNSASVLGVPPPQRCLATMLARHLTPEPWTSSIVPDRGVPRPIGNHFFQVWRVRHDLPNLPPQ